MKFKKKPQFLEFFVRVLQKAVCENNHEQAIDWCKEVNDWLERYQRKLTVFACYSWFCKASVSVMIPFYRIIKIFMCSRNEAVVGPRLFPKKQETLFGAAAPSEEEEVKWYTALVAEYAKDKQVERGQAAQKGPLSFYISLFPAVCFRVSHSFSPICPEDKNVFK